MTVFPALFYTSSLKKGTPFHRERLEQIFRFYRAIDRDRQPTFVVLLVLLVICTARQITVRSLILQDRAYTKQNICLYFLCDTSCLVRKKKNPKDAWGERIVARMKQDSITRHQVCNFALTRSICTLKIDRICSLI